MKIMTFKQALQDSEGFSKRHVLLGNGFSVVDPIFWTKKTPFLR